MAEKRQQQDTEKDELRVYYEDVIKLFAAAKHEKPLTFIATYFENVSSGKHILFRTFEYISRTAHNRRSFIEQFRAIFAHFYSANVNITGDEMHQLLCLLCPDFPSCLLHLALAVVHHHHDHKQGNELPFVLLARVTCKVFLYWDILQYIQQIYRPKVTLDEDQAHKYRDYVFIGELRTTLSEYAVKFPSKKELCEEILGELSSSELTHKVTLIDFCKAITMSVASEQ